MRRALRSSVLPLVVLIILVSMRAPIRASTDGRATDRDASIRERLAPVGPSAPTTVAPSAVPSGWLILDGRLMAGPFEVRIVGDAVCVNGQALTEVPIAPAIAPTLPVHELRHAIILTLHTAYAEQLRSRTPERAREAVLAWVKEQPSVARVGAEESGLRIWFGGDPESEMVLLRVTPPSTSAAEERERILEQRATSVRHSLSTGCLVIWSEGVWMTLPAAQAQTALADIRGALRTADLRLRIAAISRTVPDERLATVIARRMK